MGKWEKPIQVNITQKRAHNGANRLAHVLAGKHKASMNRQESMTNTKNK